MCTIRKIYHEEIHYDGQVPTMEPRYELCDGTVVNSVSETELAKYLLFLEEQTADVMEIVETSEKSKINAERFFKEIDS